MQTKENPFGSPFEVIPFQDNFTQPQNFAPTTSLRAPQSVSLQPLPPTTAHVETVSAFDLGDIRGFTCAPPGVTSVQHPPTPPTNSPFSVVPSENNFTAQPTNIQPPPRTPNHSPFSAVPSENNFAAQPTNIQHPPTHSPFSGVHSEDNSTAQPTNIQHHPTTPTHSPYRAVPSEDNFIAQPQNFVSGTSLHPATSVVSEPLQSTTANVETVPVFNFGDMFHCITYTPPGVNSVQLPSTNQEPLPSELPSGQQSRSDDLGNILPHSGHAASAVSQAALTVSPLPTVKDHPSKNKFEPKSAVWADTLSRGLVDLNISGRK